MGVDAAPRRDQHLLWRRPASDPLAERRRIPRAFLQDRRLQHDRRLRRLGIPGVQHVADRLLALLMGPLRLCGGGLGGAVVRGDPLDAGAVELVFGSQALRRRIGRRRFGHDRRRGRRLDLCDRRLERLGLPPCRPRSADGR